MKPPKRRYFVLNHERDITAVVISKSRKQLHFDIYTTKFDGVKNIKPSTDFIQWVMAHYDDERPKSKVSFEHHNLP